MNYYDHEIFHTNSMNNQHCIFINDEFNTNIIEYCTDILVVLIQQVLVGKFVLYQIVECI
jgi:hypothetical protein